MKQITAYIDNNGNFYTSKEMCAHSDGLVKCKICSGSGIEHYEHVEIKPYPQGLPDSGWVDDERIVTNKTRECSRCIGLGYVISNIEDDKEYQQYIMLKNKFEIKKD